MRDTFSIFEAGPSRQERADLPRFAHSSRQAGWPSANGTYRLPGSH